MPGVIVNIDVPDLTRGIAFYRDGLGFTLLRTLFGGAVAELDADGTRLYLIEAEAGSNAVPGEAAPRTYGPHWTPVHLDVVVDELEPALARALAAGATRSGTDPDRDWGTVIPLRDPFGHGVCLIQFREGGYDQVADPA